LSSRRSGCAPTAGVRREGAGWFDRAASRKRRGFLCPFSRSSNMEPKHDEPPEAPQQAEQSPAPKKLVRLKRFQIVKLEERIAPGQSGGLDKHYTDHNCYFTV